MKKIASILASSLLVLPLLWACSDSDETMTAQKRGTLTIQLSSGDLVRSRASNTDDREYYMGTVDLYFYTGDADAEDAETKAAVYAIRGYKAEAYDQKLLEKGLSDQQMNTLFPGSATTCRIYAVANVPGTLLDPLSEESYPSIQTLKALALKGEEVSSLDPTGLHPSTDTNMTLSMSGTGTLTLDTQTMTMSGSVTFERAMAKVTLDISVAQEITLTDERKYQSMYESAGSSNEGIQVVLYHAARNGLLEGQVAESDRGYTNYENYIKTYTATGVSTSAKQGDTEITYNGYTHEAFYSYPTDWASNSGESVSVLRLKVLWKDITDGEESASFTPYYYQLPINESTLCMLRNHHYKITLKVGMLGSTVPEDPLAITDGIDYEIADWGNDGLNLSDELSKNHYLVVEDNLFTLTNDSEVDFSFNTCGELKGVYLESVSFPSTYYTDSGGDEETVYLYRADYNSSSNSFAEVTEKSENYYNEKDTDVQSKYSKALTNLKAIMKDGSIITYEEEVVDGVKTGNGTVSFKADVQEITGRIYHPVTYSIVLVNTTEHKSLRARVRIVQYPARYIQFGAGDNVFVNGYYGHLSSKSILGSTENATGYYRSYAFPVVTKSSSKLPQTVTYSSVSNNDSYTGYYKTDKEQSNYMSTDYGGSSSSSDYTTTQRAVNTSYEYVRGQLNDNTKSVNFTKTVDVYVSAFSTDDNTFSVTKMLDDSNETFTYEYVIGSALKKGSFVKDDDDDGHKTDSYSRDANTLYDYYVEGAKSGSSYYGYVQSWGDNAGKILIGAFNTNFDNSIAPSFKVASSYGATSGSSYFDVAQKRCATYQEAGYPAGRWRLPTLAEIAFLLQLQNLGVIQKMFDDSTSGAYWTCSGGAIQPIQASSTSSTLAKYWEEYYKKGMTEGGNYWEVTNRKGFARCVYDLWYYGTAAETSTSYHVKPNGVN